jgi:rubrerythrin
MANKSVDSNNMINTRDCLQRAWNNTMELVRDFEMYSKGVEDNDVKSAFKDMAEKQGKMAQDLREMFNKYNQES